MSKVSGAGSALGKIIAWLFAIVLIVAIVGVALYFGLRSQGATYYVEYDGGRYFGGSDSDNISLATGSTYEFSVKSLTGDGVNYSAKIVANDTNKVRFSIGDELYSLYNDDEVLDDYSEIFDLQTQSESFSFVIPKDFAVVTAIKAKYGADIVLRSDIVNDLPYFSLVVTVGESSVVIDFLFDGQADTPVSGVTLDPPSIIF